MHLTHDPNAPAADPIGFDDFLKVDIRVGTIMAAERPWIVLMIMIISIDPDTAHRNEVRIKSDSPIMKIFFLPN